MSKHPKPEPPPTVAYVDQQAKAYQDTSAILERFRSRLISLTRKWGGAHARKSQLLRGELYELLVTVGNSVSLDSAAIATFKHLCDKYGASALFHKCFKPEKRWTLRPLASFAIGDRPALLQAFHRCVTISTNAPSLIVRKRQHPKGKR